MRRVLLFLLLPTLLLAQSYSRWNYKDAKPNDTAADAAMIAAYQASIDNHATGDLSIHKSYRYPTATDSSFAVTDVNAKVVRLFDPRPVGGVTELAREDTVVVLSKHSPIKKQIMVGGDGILPKGQEIAASDIKVVAYAAVKANVLRKAVQDSIKKNPSSGNTAAKRAKVWKAVVQKEKEKKIKASGLGKITK